MVSSGPGSGTAPLDGIRVVELGGGVPAGFCTHLLAGLRRRRGAGVDRPPTWPSPPTRTATCRAASGASTPASRSTRCWPRPTSSSTAARAPRGPSSRAPTTSPPPTRTSSSRPSRRSASTVPHAGHRATNIVSFASGGIMSITGEPDRPPLQTGGDQALMLGGLHAFAATSTALLGALVQGEGDLIDISLQECAASMLEYCAAAWEYEGLLVERSGNTPRAEWGVYQAADGWAGVCCLGRQLPALFEQLGARARAPVPGPRAAGRAQRRADGPRARVHARAHQGRAGRARPAEQAADRRGADAGRARRPRRR